MVYKDCCFLRRYSTCGILTITACRKNCKFYKTQHQYEVERDYAAMALKARGLKAVIDKQGDQQIVTTKSIYGEVFK